jgi:hypothetical protein
MKKRLLPQFSLKNITLLLSLTAVCFVLSCSKNSTSPVPSLPKGKTAKFTISVNGATNDDYISFVFSGASNDVSGSTTIWKVNGVTQENEQAISFAKNDFTGSTKTYVIESTTPLAAIATSVQCISTSTTSYTISYKAEIDGQVSGDYQNITVAENQDYTHQFNY